MHECWDVIVEYFYMIRWNVDGVVFKLNIVTTTTKTPHLVMKVVFSWLSERIPIWLYPLNPSKKL